MRDSHRKYTIPDTCRCIEKSPDSQSVLFGGQFINFRLVAEEADLSKSMVSKVFNGYRDPSIHSAERIANALCTTLDDFWQALKERKDLLPKNGARKERHE